MLSHICQFIRMVPVMGYSTMQLWGEMIWRLRQLTWLLKRNLLMFTQIAVRVYDIMRRDNNKDPDTFPNALLAEVLIDQIDRKLVKQTVMTSVYGVTYIGAREQIKRRLEEKGLVTDDRLLYAAACYAATVTLAALGEVFEAARGIMGWLGDCAKVIAQENQAVPWTTPLGLPVVQPYCKTERYQIRTSLQLLALQREGSAVSVKKQRTAFPPNYVHSLDSSHMMMTALAFSDAGLCFAGVHDSFWTHPCDVEKNLWSFITCLYLKTCLRASTLHIQDWLFLHYQREVILTYGEFLILHTSTEQFSTINNYKLLWKHSLLLLHSMVDPPVHNSSCFGRGGGNPTLLLEKAWKERK